MMTVNSAKRIVILFTIRTVYYDSTSTYCKMNASSETKSHLGTLICKFGLNICNI